MAEGTSNGWLIITERQLALAAWAPRAAALLRQWRAGEWSGQLNGDTDALLAELEGQA